MVLRCPIVTGMDNDTTPIPAAAVPKRPALGKRRFTPQLKARIVKRWVREHHMRGLSKGTCQFLNMINSEIDLKQIGYH
jgi:hypothetical protein